jgi:sugar phosphate isomerase/epimerase
MLLGGAALAGAAGLSGMTWAAAQKRDSTVAGVKLGICLYDFRDIPRPANQDQYIDLLVDASVKSGAAFVEINSSNLEPRNDLPFAGIPRIQDARQVVQPGQPTPKWMTWTPAELQAAREDLRKWRVSTPMSYFEGVRRKFEAAGLTPFSYVHTFTPDMTDAEIDAAFRQARALGVNIFSTNQTKVEMGPRLVAYADRYRCDMGFHNHTQTKNPNEVASTESFEKLFALSPRFKANLDVAHYVAANQDALAFLKAHPDRITHLHMKDRKRDEGPGTPWGQGDAPLKEMLLIIRDQKLPIPCIVEYEYRGTGTGLEETIKCMDFMRRTLTA